MSGWRVPDNFRSDGCTFAPDRWFGKDLTPACRLHDFLRLYDLVPVEEADRIFYHKLLELGAPRLLARIYWVGVKLLRPFREKPQKLPLWWEQYRRPLE